MRIDLKEMHLKHADMSPIHIRVYNIYLCVRLREVYVFPLLFKSELLVTERRQQYTVFEKFVINTNKLDLTSVSRTFPHRDQKVSFLSLHLFIWLLLMKYTYNSKQKSIFRKNWVFGMDEPSVHISDQISPTELEYITMFLRS